MSLRNKVELGKGKKFRKILRTSAVAIRSINH